MFDRLRRGLGIGLTVCLLAGLPVALPKFARAQTGRVNRALLIGVDDFVSRDSTYPASTNNVFAMQEALQGSSEPFDTIMIPDAPVTTVDALSRLICDTFANADEDDASYLYISTHGEFAPDSGEEPALLLSDGVSEARLTPRALQAALAGIHGVKVLLLDACYSGAFIGKGMRTQPEALCFLGSDYKVLTSSGAMEESWYWNTAKQAELAADGYQQGAFYFTQAMAQSLSPRSGFSADANRDGKVTLRELYRTLLANHAASTPQVYPQEDDYPIFTYDVQDAAIDSADRSPIRDVTFSSSTLSEADPNLTLEFIALRPVRVAYQIVHRREGTWRFDEAQLIYDSVEQYTAFGDEKGAISPGRKVRTLALNPSADLTGGYLLVQLVSMEGGKLTVQAGQVIAIPPAQGDLQLGVEVGAHYQTSEQRELPVFVKHACPCQLSVSIINTQGETVRRLCHRQSTRPLGIVPEGSTFYWDGLDKTGDVVKPGDYLIRVEAYLGDEQVTVDSSPVTVSAHEG